MKDNKMFGGKVDEQVSHIWSVGVVRMLEYAEGLDPEGFFTSWLKELLIQANLAAPVVLASARRLLAK